MVQEQNREEHPSGDNLVRRSSRTIHFGNYPLDNKKEEGSTERHQL